MSVTLGITRNDGESWRDCAARYGKRHGLEYEVLEDFDADIARGRSEEDAAWGACCEWDVCDLQDVAQ